MKNTHLINGSLENLYTLDPQDDFETNEKERERMKRYINAVMEMLLTGKQRAIIKMRFSGLSISEIAERSLMTERAVKKNLKVAMGILIIQKNIFIKGN